LPENTRTSAPSNTPVQSAPAQPAPTTMEALLAQTLSQLSASNAKIAELMEKQTAQNEFAQKNAPRRKKTMAEYLIEKPRKRLLHEAFQNGRLVNPKGLSRATLEKLDTLNSGHYADGMVDVVRIKDGVEGINSRIHIVYNNKTLEQRIMFYMRFRTFTELVNAIADEMVARDIPPVHDKAADPIEPEIEEFAVATK
jgi:hypothetical protein